MKKVLVMVLSLIVLAGMSFTAQGEVNSNVDGLDIKVTVNNDPPAVGENNLSITLTDPEGNKVTNAKIKIAYSMKPMGSMPTMMYKARPKLDGENYKAKINLAMSGQWNIVLNIKRLGKGLTKMPFKLVVP